MAESDRDDYIKRDDPIEIVGESGSVSVSRVYTPKGTRLEIDDGTDRIRLDPMALESITWQDADNFPLELPSDPGLTAEVVSGGDPAEITNEFAQVTFNKLVTDEGDELAVDSRKLGFSIRLSVPHLQSIARQDPEVFSSFLEEPYGPEDEH